MIIKYYEFSCDYDMCGFADYPPAYSKRQAIWRYRKDGGIVTHDEKCFCDKACFKKYNEDNN